MVEIIDGRKLAQSRVTRRDLSSWKRCCPPGVTKLFFPTADFFSTYPLQTGILLKYPSVLPIPTDDLRKYAARLDFIKIGQIVGAPMSASLMTTALFSATLFWNHVEGQSACSA
ncbi:hypothetical protein DUT91_07475 [Phyllobacterium salinisoli]|uniref:Uncharacterized protein n=1 Tax=Phyllobacterium salinisoli TaxID=1899321 RepID=A0A368K446_9HYPH|nr:hypothetical protein [Phyllobacterium salinisoli]RCS24156.1 hypothetical protein DUT91_07475 [Phyllobacterium salinisoli]